VTLERAPGANRPAQPADRETARSDEDAVLAPEEPQELARRGEAAERPQREPREEEESDHESGSELEWRAARVGRRAGEECDRALHEHPQRERFAERPAAEPEREERGAEEAGGPVDPEPQLPTFVRALTDHDARGYRPRAEASARKSGRATCDEPDPRSSAHRLDMARAAS
jgi:hypothetical protein